MFVFWKYVLFLTAGICTYHDFTSSQLGVTATVLSAFQRSSVLPLRSALDRDTRYAPWPNPTRILYRLDSSYNAREKTLIQRAMSQISDDMDQCVRFREYVPGSYAGSDHIVISKTLSSGQSVPTCFSFPGRVLQQAGRGQTMVLYDAPNGDGCMASTRDVIKYLMHVLGIRAEYNRPDRDKYIEVFTGNIRPELQALNILKKYTEKQVDYANSDFDFNSVTITTPTKFAIPGTLLFTSVSAGQTFGNLARLSQGDCEGLALQYDCSFSVCKDPYANSTTSSTKKG